MSAFLVININDLIILETIAIWKNFKIKLPDAIIYASDLVEESPLLTNNIDDFKSLGGKVDLISPFDL